MRTLIHISGMTCGACSSSVTTALERLTGVSSANVSLITETASILHDESLTPQEIKEAVEGAGFDATIELVPPRQSSLESAVFQVYGMTCSACANSIENVLSQLPGVNEASVNLATEQASIVYDSQNVGVRQLVAAIEGAGFDAMPATALNNSAQIAALKRVSETRSYLSDTFKVLVFGLPVILLQKLEHWHRLPHLLSKRIIPGLYVVDLICLLLTLPIQFGVGLRFYRKCFKSLRARNLNMDVLVTLSTSSAFFYSISSLSYAVITGSSSHQMYLWDTSAMIFLFVVFGKFLENKARGHTSEALSTLIALVPEEATLLEKNEATGVQEERQISTDMLQVGDVVLLRPGEKIPADGEVLSGESHVSEAMLTGESEPIRKGPGTMVAGGTVNGSGALHFRVTHCGSQTKLAQIVRLVKDAQAAKAPIQRYADYIVSKFVVSVVILALLTLVAWLLLTRILPRLPSVFESTDSKFFVCFRMCISVIVVACPCALGLATPTAVMMASGVGAKNGILVKSGAAFENLSHVDAVLFDKTGTITSGNMTVRSTDIPDKWWPLLAMVERESEHPAARALVLHAGDLDQKARGSINIVEAKAVLGRGVEAVVELDGEQLAVLIGSRKLMAERQVAVNGDNLGTVCVAIDGAFIGSLTLADQIRADATVVVDDLISQGFFVGLVSGDARSAVEHVAATIGIPLENVWAETSPEDKVNVIQTLQQSGKHVAFIGDGINDSPALASASVGISLEGATHVAVESADVVLVRQNPITGISGALDLGRAALRRIKFNLFASLMYNVIMIPMSMGALLPFGIMLNPMAASAAMAASSVSVVLSSLMLKSWKPPVPKLSTHSTAFGSGRTWRCWLPSFGSREAHYTPLETV